MKKIRILSLILTLALVITAIPFTVFAEGEEAVAENSVKSEIPYCDPVSFSLYTDTKQEIMTADQITDSNVKAGCSGYVMKLTNANAGIGLTIDPAAVTGNEIKLSELESITVRAYLVGTNVKSTRATIDATAASWLLNEAPSGYDQWIEYSIPVGKLAYEDGETVSPFCLAFRFTNNTMETTVYIDSVTLNVKLDPELGKAEIPYTAEGSPLSIYGYSAMALLDAAKAEKAGVTGIEGDYVMKFTGASSQGDSSFMIDLRQSVCKDVKIEDVESVTFRVWIPHKMDLRIKSVEGNDWQYIASHTPAEGGGWINIKITDMSTFVPDGNGYFSPFAFTFRNNWNPGAGCIVYFDGVTVELEEKEPVKTHYTFAEGMGKEEIPYGEKANVGTYFGHSSFMMMDETQAVAAGVPAGYSGWVLAIGSDGGNAGIGLDLTKFQTRDIEKITFRVWCPTGTKQHATEGGVRLSGKTASTWSMLANPTALNEWIDVVLEKDDFSSLDFDEDGYCDPMNFGFRGATSTAYIDHITVKLRDPDTEPPVITYNGETVIETREGRDFVLDLTAHDAYYDVDITPEYIWSDGALDGNGKLVAGTHTCTVKATDEAGNVAEIVLTVNVGERDVEAPKFDWTPETDKFFAMEGAMPFIVVNATDNVDKVEVVLTWSEGALDEFGRLTAGEHILTVSATDLSGNRSEYTITFTVISSRPTVGDVVQDT